MIRVSVFQGKTAVDGTLEKLRSGKKCWADCVCPTKKELQDLSKAANIPLKDLQETLDPDERPSTRDLENYSLIIVRAPWYEHGKVTTTPLAIFLSKNKNNIITIALKELHAIHKAHDLVRDGKIDIASESVGFFIYHVLDAMLDSYFLILDHVEDTMDKIEHKVVRDADKMNVETIFSVKKALIYFNKSLTANREVIGAIEKEYVAHIDKKNSKRFAALYAEVSQLIDMVSTNKDVMTSTLDIYVSSVSNNLNQAMKTLTIIASFVLVPTLISGIYGMNFQSNSPWNMPELAWKYGYLFALGLMAISVIITYIYFKRKGWM